MLKDPYLSDQIINHPAFYDFYDEWKCGTEDEVNKQFDWIWKNYANKEWGSSEEKEHIRKWILKEFADIYE